MEIRTKISPHPQLIETLFAFRYRVFRIFNEVLGLHEIDHIAITRIDKEQRIAVFSSIPAIEHNLFQACSGVSTIPIVKNGLSKKKQQPGLRFMSQVAIMNSIILRQIKPQLPTSLSLSTLKASGYYIYSFASHSLNPRTAVLFQRCQKELYEIGHYCNNLLQSIFPE